MFLWWEIMLTNTYINTVLKFPFSPPLLSKECSAVESWNRVYFWRSHLQATCRSCDCEHSQIANATNIQCEASTWRRQHCAAGKHQQGKGVCVEPQPTAKCFPWFPMCLCTSTPVFGFPPLPVLTTLTTVLYPSQDRRRVVFLSKNLSLWGYVALCQKDYEAFTLLQNKEITSLPATAKWATQ